LGNLIKISSTLKRKKKKKIIFKSLIKKLNSKLNKNLNSKTIQKYCELHKILNRQNSNYIYLKIAKALFNDDSKSIKNERKKYHRFFAKTQTMLHLKLSKKIRTINYLIKSLKKSKKIKRKR
jgi:hypothetical protein